MVMTMSSSAPPAADLPPVDARLVAPESGYEIVDGKVVAVAPAREPHGERHSKVNALLEAFAADDHNVACDMLTRTSETTDIAPDASVYPIARDPRTGGRQLEVLAFEVVSTQTLSDAADKAWRLSARGVRGVFAIDVSHQRVLQWSPETGSWQVLPDAASIEDPSLVAPLPVEALVKAAKADDAMAHALLAKRNPVVVAAIERAEADVGRRALYAILDARGTVLGAPHRARIDACHDVTQLLAWTRRAASTTTADDLFG